jgi:hypothetical protein
MDTATSRVDMHCHSVFAPPERIYARAKQRGMDFVTITDHDSIAAVRQIADRPDVFVSVELSARFRDAPQTVRVLCWGVSEYDHRWLQRHRDDVEVCAAYLREHRIACALAHPFQPLSHAPLTPRQRRRLGELFPAARRLGDGTGLHIGHAYTETPVAATPREFLAHVRAGRAEARMPEAPRGIFLHTVTAA